VAIPSLKQVVHSVVEREDVWLFNRII